MIVVAFQTLHTDSHWFPLLKSLYISWKIFYHTHHLSHPCLLALISSNPWPLPHLTMAYISVCIVCINFWHHFFFFICQLLCIVNAYLWSASYFFCFYLFNGMFTIMFLMRLSMYMLMDVFRCLLNKQVRHMFDEIDYVQEGKNADRFASLYGCYPCKLFPTSNLCSICISFQGRKQCRYEWIFLPVCLEHLYLEVQIWSASILRIEV